ncbi:TIR domain-containing protein [Planktotalea sp.]|uniref:TIR domain-containing protein n=1 Tax=Planktotalea sp. TaxID=2029877 RepID=UPI00329A57FE
MANPLHVGWLQDGVEAWNKRRRKAPFFPDFQGANLRGADLRGVDLLGADLLGADVSTITISAKGTNDESSAKYTDLSLTIGLSPKQLQSMIGDNGTILPNGFDHPKHWPTIDLPKDHPNYEPIQEHQEHQEHQELDQPAQSISSTPFVFLSYASNDRSTVDEIRQLFEQSYISHWWDQDIPTGGIWRDEIANHLNTASAVVTFWTATSVDSQAVIEEASQAQQARKLIPVRLDDSPLPYGFSETQYIDLKDWDGTETDPVFQRLIQTLQDKLDPPSIESLGSRMSAASPAAFVRAGKQLGVKDTPANIPPAIDDARERAAKIDEVFRLAARISRALEQQLYNVPHDFSFRLNELLVLQENETLRWDTLSTERDSVCTRFLGSADDWNEGFVGDIRALNGAVEACRDYLQPEQPAEDSPNAKPIVTDPDLSQRSDVVLQVQQDFDELLSAPEAEELLNDDAREVFRREINELKRADSIDTPPEEKAPARIRTLKRTTLLVSSLAAAISSSVIANLLSSPGSVALFSERVFALRDLLLSLFL